MFKYITDVQCVDRRTQMHCVNCNGNFSKYCVIHFSKDSNLKLNQKNNNNINNWNKISQYKPKVYSKTCFLLYDFKEIHAERVCVLLC